MKKMILILLVTCGIGLSVTLSGCSNKPNLKKWSKATAAYLIHKNYPKYAFSKISCKSSKLTDSATCYLNITGPGFESAKYDIHPGYNATADFTQSVNGNWRVSWFGSDQIAKPLPDPYKY